MAAKKLDAFDMSPITDALNSGSLLDAFKAKQTADFLENLSPMVQKRVEVLKQIQSEHDEIEAKFFEERRALEDKYQKLYQPLYSKRYDVVNGVVEVDGVSDEPADEAADKTTEEKGVPNFWFIAMKTNEVLAETIQEQDEDALKYLKDIKWCRIDVSKVDNHKGEATKGFKLEFFFDTNPFFKNSVLTKTYLMIDEDEPILEKAIGTEIEWFPGKCLTEKVLKKKPNKRSKNTKPITKTETVDSFFNFFNPPDVPENDEDLEEEAVEELQSMMELDYDVGSTIREKIIPHAVSWFTGEAAQDDDFDLGDEDVEDDEEDDEDEEDEDEEDDDEEDEDDDKANSQKKGSAKTQGGEAQPAGEKPPECKQQ